MLLSGCKDVEFSYDADFGGRPNGAMTRAAIEELKKNPATPQDWFNGIRKRLPSQQYPQTPQLFGGTQSEEGADVLSDDATPAIPTPSTPDATAGVAQSKDRQTEASRPRTSRRTNTGDMGFDVSPSLSRHVQVHPYQRRPGDPVYRPLRIFALDPAVSKLEGAVALVNVPYEQLERGPRGRLFHVKETDNAGGPAAVRGVTSKTAGFC